MRIVILIALLAILLGLVACLCYWPHATSAPAKQMTTRGSLSSLHHAVIQFKMDTGRYPTGEEGLRVLIEEPAGVTGWNHEGYLKTAEIPRDSWGREFVFILKPEERIPFAILSYGADGAPGGEGEDADLSSRDPD